MLIGRELDERGITTPAAIGDALDMPAAEAVKLLRGQQWREGDFARLQAPAARLGVCRCRAKVAAPMTGASASMRTLGGPTCLSDLRVSTEPALIKNETVVLFFAFVLAGAVITTSSLSSRTRAFLYLLALVACVLAALHRPGTV